MRRALALALLLAFGASATSAGVLRCSAKVAKKAPRAAAKVAKKAVKVAYKVAY